MLCVKVGIVLCILFLITERVVVNFMNTLLFTLFCCQNFLLRVALLTISTYTLYPFRRGSLCLVIRLVYILCNERILGSNLVVILLKLQQRF